MSRKQTQLSLSLLWILLVLGCSAHDSYQESPSGRRGQYQGIMICMKKSGDGNPYPGISLSGETVSGSSTATVITNIDGCAIIPSSETLSAVYANGLSIDGPFKVGAFYSAFIWTP